MSGCYDTGFPDEKFMLGLIIFTLTVCSEQRYYRLVTMRLNAYTGGNNQGTPASATGTMLAVVDTDYGYAMEVAVPLETFNIEIAHDVVIGFNMQLNDDDDGAGRDHKLSWSEKELQGGEVAYLYPSVFGELVFLQDFLAVSAEGKLATTWASGV